MKLSSIVCDFGSGFIKMGPSSFKNPQIVEPNLIWLSKMNIKDLNKFRHKIYFGNEALNDKNVKSLSYINESGTIKMWEYFENLLNHLLSKYSIQLEGKAIVLCQNKGNRQSDLEQLTEILFEKHNLWRLYVECPEILSLYASGKLTGLVVDSGDSLTRIMSIFEGRAIPESKIFKTFGGRDILDFLCDLLIDQQVYKSQFRQNLAGIKHEICNPLKKIEFILPDQKKITFSYQDQIKAFDKLFSGENDLNCFQGIQNEIISSLNLSPLDTFPFLIENIILAGGNTLFQGCEVRLKDEINKMGLRFQNIRLDAHENRQYHAWVGGSIISQLDNVLQDSITQEKYKENGINCVKMFNL